MNLTEYFENTKGTGVLATADREGNVDVAVYARPHCINQATLAFIMNERLSYKNLTKHQNSLYSLLLTLYSLLQRYVPMLLGRICIFLCA